MNSLSSIFQQSNPFESQIQQILRIDRLKKVSLQQEQSNLQTQKTALSDISSKLSSLDSLLTSFSESPQENFRPLTGSSTNSDAVSIVSTSGMNNPASFNTSVNQLAKQDMVISGSLANDGSGLSSAGSGSFDITIGSQAALTVNIDTTDLTNKEVMDAVATQVNDQLGDNVTTSVFKLDGTNSQLSIKSKETGKDFQISINNVQGDLTGLNLTNKFTTDELNAKFSLDGINFERSSNLISDAVDGLTFELKKTTGADEKLEIVRDLESAKESINSFIEKFNATNEIIRSKTLVDAENEIRGPLSRERNVRNLSHDLRLNSTQQVESLSDSSVSTLADIGIELSQNGTMEITDSKKLDEALQTNPNQLEQLFTAEDGLIAGLQQTVNLHMTGESNVFNSIEQGIDSKIDRLDNRIESENNFLERREEELRAEFAQLQQIIDQGQAQFNQVLSFQNNLGI